jgi:hypothetical protein
MGGALFSMMSPSMTKECADRRLGDVLPQRIDVNSRGCVAAAVATLEGAAFPQAVTITIVAAIRLIVSLPAHILPRMGTAVIRDNGLGHAVLGSLFPRSANEPHVR